MKKILFGLFVSVLLLTGVYQVDASPVEESITRTLMEGMKGSDVSYLQTYLGIPSDGYYGPQTVTKVRNWQRQNSILADGMFGPGSLKKLVSNQNTGSVLGATADTTPRIMYWYGKVNQHVDSNGVWLTDSDGRSGADLDKLSYCKKWFLNTTSVEDYQYETTDTWKAAGNQGYYTSTKMSTRCIESSTMASDNQVLQMKGSLSSSPSTCTISKGANSCQVTLYWDTINPVGTSRVTLIDRTIVYTGNMDTKTINVLKGSKTYYLENNGVPLDEERVTASCESGSVWNGYSCAVSDVAAPSITVTSPNGGENYIAGQQINVQWKSENVGVNGNISISLKGEKNSYQLISYTANDGQEIVTLPSDLSGIGYPVDKFKILVGIKSFETPIDFSDNYFTITSPTNTFTNDMACGLPLTQKIESTSSSTEINSLQKILNGLGYLSTASVDGKLGSATLNAIKDFQLKNGLVADGVVNIFTINSLNKKWAEKCVGGNNLLPDLTAEILNTVGGYYSDSSQDIEVHAKIRNKGTVSTKDDFMNVFMFATGPNGTGKITYNSNEVPIGVLDGNSVSSDIIRKFLLKVGNEYSFRVCADQEGDAYGKIGDIKEINENNNCSSWNNVKLEDKLTFCSRTENKQNALICLDEKNPIKITSLNGDEKLVRGTKHIITWSNNKSTYKEGYNLSLRTPASTIFLADNVVSPYSWDVGYAKDFPNGNLPDGIYSLGICEANYPFNCVIGNNFTITSPTNTFTNDMACGLPLTQKIESTSSSTEINGLQKILNGLGYLSTASVDGKLGSATLNAIKDFQLKNGLVADGVVNIFTINSLNKKWSEKCGGGSNSTSSITVIYPNGEVNYKLGDLVTVKWKSENIGVGSKLSIYLREEKNDLNYILASLSANDGQEIVTLPLDLFRLGIGDPGDKFLISLGLEIENSTRYYSKYFTITSPNLPEDPVNQNQSPVKANDCSKNISSREMLKIGSTGNQVEILQSILNYLGYLNPYTTNLDGFKFGSQTELAVKEFQKLNKLQPDGIVGSNTINALNAKWVRECSAPSSSNSNSNNSSDDTLQTKNNTNPVNQNQSPVKANDCSKNISSREMLKIGSTGNQVEILQSILNYLGYLNPYTTNLDGFKFGSQTELAVKEFQKLNKLQPDGIVGSNTINALNAKWVRECSNSKSDDNIDSKFIDPTNNESNKDHTYTTGEDTI